MKFGSVSSGIDAASVAFGPLGWKAQWFSEIAAFPSAVLKHHYPDIPNLGDMTKIYGKSEFTDRTVDLICGGTPCQSFSVAGLRGGLSDERGNLSLEFCKIVHTKKSRWVLWENVPGVLSSKDNAFGCFLAALSGAEAPLLPGTRDGKWSKSGIVLGQVYGLAWRVLDAQYFGVPQRRRRVFVVGYLGNWKPAAEVLFEREGLRGNIATGRTERKDITRTTSARASGCGGINYQVNRKVSHGEYTLDNKSSPVLARDYKDSSDLITQYGPVAGTLSARRDSSPCADRGMNIVYNIGHASEGVGCLSGDHESRPTDTGHCVVEKHTVRRLTPVECERLQGFPDNYTRIAWRGKPAEQCPDGPRYKAIGNSWAVPCVRWIGERIQAVDGILKKGDDMKTAYLKFEKPPELTGKTQTTVRAGRIIPLAVFAVLSVEGELIGQAQLQYVQHKRFDCVEPEDIAAEHDPACRTIEGLGAALARFYPGFKASGMVSVIEFKLEAKPDA